MYKRRLCPSVTALNCQMENHVSEKSERSQNTSDDSLRLMRTHLQTHFKHRLPVADEKQYKCAECSYPSTDHGLLLRHKCKGGNKKQLKSLGSSKMHTSEEYRPLCLMPGEFGNVDNTSERDNNPIQSISGSEDDLLTTLADSSNPASPSPNLQPGNEIISEIDEEKCTIDMHGNIQKWRVCHLCTFAETSVSAYKFHMEDHVAEMPERNQRVSHICQHKRRPMRRLPIHVDKKPYRCTLCPYASTDYGRLLHHNCSGGGNKKPLRPLIPSKTHNSEKLRPLCLPPGGSCNFGSNLKHPGTDTAINESVIDSEPLTSAALTPIDISSHELPSTNRQSGKENMSRINKEKCKIDMSSSTGYDLFDWLR